MCEPESYRILIIADLTCSHRFRKRSRLLRSGGFPNTLPKALAQYAGICRGPHGNGAGSPALYCFLYAKHSHGLVFYVDGCIHISVHNASAALACICSL